MKDFKIRFLHFVRDDKFIDRPLRWFDEDGRFENIVVMLADSPDYKFRFIKESSRIKLLYNKRLLRKELQKGDYDVVFFYALTDYRILNFIPKNKIVIWWAWGYDIYGPDYFINLPLFKPLTKSYLTDKRTSLSVKIKRFLKKIPLFRYIKYGNRNNAIKRIDYFQPVIHIEYELMKQVKGFRAHEFYYPGCWDFTNLIEGNIPAHGNSVLVGHCASDTNNHIDVWERVKCFIPSGASVYFPVSYGDSGYAEHLINTIVSDKVRVVFLKEFLPEEEYFGILDSCGYAVFGVLREQATGNIVRCLIKGVKVFLYRDSILYRYFRDMGCAVYTIEDIDEISFKIPMTLDQIRHNQRCLINECGRVNDTRENAIEEIIGRINKNIL